MRKIDRLHPDDCHKLMLDTFDENKLKTQTIPLKEANNKILAQDIHAAFSVPHFDKSPYDGYAFKASDSKGASQDSPITLEVIEEVKPGHTPKHQVKAGQAVKILTGAQVPQGVDVCVKYEWTEFGDGFVKIYQEFQPGDIIPKGEDCLEGKLLIEKGEKLTPARIGVIASQGLSQVQVYQKPKVGIFSSGDELTEIGHDLNPAKIYDSNIPTLSAVFSNLGYEVVDYGIIEDDLTTLKEYTTKAVEEVDLLVTTGGASVGDYDYAVVAMEELGAEVLFWKAMMRPGGSMVASIYKNTMVLGLSGNPASALLALYKVCLPYIYKLTGRKNIYPRTIKVRLLEDFTRSSPGFRLLRGQLVYQDNTVWFKENPAQGNGVLSSFADCDALCQIEPGTGPLKAGVMLDAFLVSDIFGSIGQ